MAKKLLQDMVFTKHTKKNIILNKKVEKLEPILSDDNFLEKQKENININKKTNPKYTLWFIALIAIVFLIFAISSLFAKAKVVVNPKTQNVIINQDLTAQKDSNKIDILPFSLISLSDEESSSILAGNEKNYLEKAKGTVIIYNNFSSSSQRLAIDTRLEGSNDKIYKIEKEVVVPGIKDGKPGFVEVDIYASEAGEEYNSPPIDFSILGFKGSAKYDKFYARSKGEIKGGLKGNFRLIEDQDKDRTIEELKKNLEEKLYKKAIEQLPEGYVLFRNAFVLKIDKEEIDMSSLENNIPIKISGTLSGFLFEEKVLTKKIIKTIIPQYEGDGNDIYILNLKDMIFTLSNKDNLSSITQNIDFNIKGDSKIVWRIEEEKIQNSLLGKSKKDFKKILAKYENINSADLILRPFWRTTIPSKFKDIKIIINYPK